MERFKPTSGVFLGYAGLAMALFAVGYCLFSVHTVVGLRVGLGAAFGAVLIWVSQLRPRVTAYADALLLKGSLQDIRIPYLAIEEVSVTQMLNVFAEGRRYVCVGIGKGIAAETRERAKRQRERDKLQARGTRSGRARELSEKADAAAPDQTAMSYHTFVVTRIEELVDRAKRDQRGAEVPPVTRSVALPEVVGLAVTAVAFLVSLLV